MSIRTLVFIRPVINTLDIKDKNIQEMRSSCAQHPATLDNMRSLLSTGVSHGRAPEDGPHPDLPLAHNDMVRRIAELTPARNRDLHNTSRGVRAAMGTNTPYEFRVNGNNEPEIEYPEKRDRILNFLERESTRHSLTSITIRNFELDPRIFERPPPVAVEIPGAPRLAAVLRRCPRLQSLNLSGNQIRGWGAIAEALAFCPLLVTLDVSDCHLKYHAQAFATCMYASTALTTLNLSGIQLSHLPNVRCITDALQQCISLQHLDLSNNALSNESAPLLARALPHCTKLQHLDLSDNRLRDDAGADLAQLLTELPMLEHLNLSSNYLGANSADNLAWALPRCMALTYVNLQDNRIGQHGVFAFGNNHVGTRLTYLNLSHNEINIPVEYTYGSMLDVHSLIHIILNGNRLGDNYVRNLLYELPRCTALTDLDLRYTSVGDVGLQTLPEVIRQCPLMTRIRLYGNDRISEKTKIRIRDAWHEQHGSTDGLDMDEVDVLPASAAGAE